MTLEECYARMGGNYMDVKQRLRSEKLIDKFVRKFLDDPSFVQYEAALQAKDDRSAFMALHTRKGVSQNLGMESLYEAVKEDCELFRSGWSDEAAENADALRAVYDTTCQAIREYIR